MCGHLGFPIAQTTCLIYSHCLPTLVSLTQEQTAIMLQGRQDGESLAIEGRFWGSTMDEELPLMNEQ